MPEAMVPQSYADAWERQFTMPEAMVPQSYADAWERQFNMMSEQARVQADKRRAAEAELANVRAGHDTTITMLHNCTDALAYLRKACDIYESASDTDEGYAYWAGAKRHADRMLRGANDAVS